VTFINHDEVVIVWRSDTALSASVRDHQAGVVDVRWSGDGGWSCSRCQDFGCHHVLAVRQLAAVATA
jgi:hypothetical protein